MRLQADVGPPQLTLPRLRALLSLIARLALFVSSKSKRPAHSQESKLHNARSNRVLKHPDYPRTESARTHRPTVDH